MGEISRFSTNTSKTTRIWVKFPESAKYLQNYQNFGEIPPKLPESRGAWGNIPQTRGPWGNIPQTSGPWGNIPQTSGPWGNIPHTTTPRDTHL
jgi:hypothetical protein